METKAIPSWNYKSTRPVMFSKENYCRKTRYMNGFYSAMMRALTVIVCCMAVVISARSVWLGITLARSVPTWDQWAFVKHYFAYVDHRYGWGLLFSNHNEHRIFTSRVLFFIDAILFHMDNYILYFAIYGALLGIAACLSWITVSGREGRQGFLWGTLILLGLTWSISQYENLSWAFQPQFPLVHLFAIASLGTLASALTRRRYLPLVAASLSLFFCMYSMASGLFIIAPALALAIWLRKVNRLFAIYVALYVLLAAVYFIGYENLSNVKYAGADWGAAFEYLILYLAAVTRTFASISLFIGSLSLALCLAFVGRLSWNALVRRRAADPSIAVLISVATFVLSEAVVTTYGRLSLAVDAMPPRYATSSLVFIAALLAAIWRTGVITRRRTYIVAAAAALLAIEVGANFDGRSETEWREKIAAQDTIAFAMVNGAMTEAQARLLSPWPDLQDEVTRMEALELGPFGSSQVGYRPPMNMLSNLPFGSLPTCRAEVNETSWQDEDTRLVLKGWAAAPDRNRAATWILAYDEAGRLLSFTRPSEKWPVRARNLRLVNPTLGYSLFIGHGVDASRASTLHLVALLDVAPSGGARACAISVTVEPASHEYSWAPIDLRMAENNRAEVDVKMSGSAVPNGVPAGVQVQPSLLHSQIYGTWRSGDADTGAIVMVLPPSHEVGHALAIPIENGPSQTGLSVEVSFNSTHDKITIPPSGWETWRTLEIPQSVIDQAKFQSISITVNDLGIEWGQWIAVMPPYWVQNLTTPR